MIHDPSRCQQVQDPANSVESNQPSSCKLQSCSFCQLARGGADEYLARNRVRPELKIASGSNKLLVMMDSFPIGHDGGHVLVVPRQHLISLAQFTDQAILGEVVQETAQVMTKLFPEHWLFTFEHGPGDLAGKRVQCGGCHVDHAHGHILVLPQSVEFDEIQSEVEGVLTELAWDVPVQTAASEKPFLGLAKLTNERPYLHIGRLGLQSQAVTYVQSAGQASVPSQLLRRIISTVAGKSAPLHWNWKIALQQNHESRLAQYRNEALRFQSQFNSAAQPMELVA